MSGVAGVAGTQRGDIGYYQANIAGMLCAQFLYHLLTLSGGKDFVVNSGQRMTLEVQV